MIVRSRNAVVRHDHGRARKSDDELFEPAQPDEVEIVRRLVEQEHVETGEQDRGERRARRFAAGERAGRERQQALGDAELGAHHSDAPVEVGTAERQEPFERVRVRVVGTGASRGESVGAGFERGLAAATPVRRERNACSVSSGRRSGSCGR